MGGHFIPLKKYPPILVFSFEAKSHFVKLGLKFTSPLPQPPKCWGIRCEPPHLLFPIPDFKISLKGLKILWTSLLCQVAPTQVQDFLGASLSVHLLLDPMSSELPHSLQS